MVTGKKPHYKYQEQNQSQKIDILTQVLRIEPKAKK